MAGFKASVIVLLLAVAAAYFVGPHIYPYLPHALYDQLAVLFPQDQIQEAHQDIPAPNKYPVFTKKELWDYYRGDDGSKGLYLAFFGKVYDVSAGKEHYGPGGGYHFFAGRDGTRGFVTGDFTEDGLTDKLDDLDPSLYAGFEEWTDFYKKTYKFVGYLQGNFYDASGQATEALKSAEREITVAKAEQKRWMEDKTKFPSCNSRSSAAQGSSVWCSNKSGGILRDWVGVPRLYHPPGAASVRCACVRTSGTPTDGGDDRSNRGDLDNPFMKEYDNCAPDSVTCVTKPPSV